MTKIKNLEQYFEQFGDRYLCTWSRKPAGSASKIYGYCELKDFSEQKYLKIIPRWDRDGKLIEPDYEIVFYPVENFEFDEADYSCTFSVDITSFHLSFAEQPTDKWGNTATYKDGIYWSVNEFDCFAVYYCDDSFSQFSDEFSFSDFVEEHKLESEFSEWFLDHYSEYEFISEIYHDNLCAGTASSYSYLTTNKLFNSENWQQLFTDFKLYWTD